MRKVFLLLLMIVVALGILPTTIKLVGSLTSKISVVRTDINPYRNAFANTLIEIVEGNPYLLPSKPIPSEDPQKIKINGKWQTQDPTYADGFLNEGSQTFIKAYSPLYFSKTDVKKEGEYAW
jgi:hypothetical protein